MIRTTLEKLRAARKKQAVKQEMDLEGLTKLLCAGHLPSTERKLNPTQRDFIFSPVEKKLYLGAAGAAKTVSGVGATILRALLEPGTKHCIARANYNDLLDTTLDEAQIMLDRLPPGTLLQRDKSAPTKWWLKPFATAADQGEVEPSQITFMGLQDGLGSYKFHGAFVDEVDEVEEKRFLELWSRCRLPGGSNYINGAANPPDSTHWLYTAVTGLDSQGLRVKVPYLTLFTPQERENEQNLRAGYYDELLSTLPPDMADRLVRGQWGAVFPGQPVVREFSRQIHCRPLAYSGEGTLFRFHDFGYRRPAVLWCQVDLLGRMFVLKERMGADIEAKAFAEQVRFDTRTHFAFDPPVQDYGDPAVAQKKDTGQTLAHYREAGIFMQYQHVPFDLSLDMMRRRFNTFIEKQPAIQIDAKGCPILSAALSGGYAFKEKGSINEPKKDGFYDHLVDCLRYGLYNILGAEMLGAAKFQKQQNIEYRADHDQRE